MPPGSSRSPSITSSSPSSRQRIFSAIASPFKSKSRAVADFSVELQHPHKRYHPGEVVKGSVHLRVLKPVRVQHVTVCLRGFVQVYRNPGSPGDSHKGSGAYFANGKAKKSGGEYFGNGYASLFEDEEVLCGDGRLAEGAYQFNFELDFPDRDLPSSITFERGTISYLVTATLTRPTTMSPTTTTDHEVFFVEKIDIASLEPPKPRTITLEPVSRRTRAKTHARKLVDQSERRSRKGDSNKTPSDPPRQSEGSSEPSSQATGQSAQDDRGDPANPVSPTRSEVSLATRTDDQDRASQAESHNQQSSGTSEGTTTNGSGSSLGSKVITATIESQAGGCLRGDSIPVKVNITHTKQIRSLYGVIVTLFRQARVDMHPAIPLGPTEKGQGSKYEDYYPKSMTGLGGLSLSGGGSSHVFRKDLTQTMVPLMIDPQTLTAEVTAKIRVPEGAFPTISTVPGAMISFKYYIEVVLDIQGKLTGQDRTLANLSAGVLPGHVLQGDTSDMERSAFTPFGSTIVDTANVRRDKSVVSCTFEIIVGTSDSERKRGKQRAPAEAVQEPVQPQAQRESQPPQPAPEQAYAHDQRDWYNAGPYHDQYWYQDSQYQYADYNDYPAEHDPPPPIPIPSLPDEAHMSEKERVRHAETRLLPSHPPGADDAADASAGATAPFLPQEETNGAHAWPAVPAYEPSAAASASNSNARAEDGTVVAHMSEKERIRHAETSLLPSQPPGADDAADASAGATAPFLPLEETNGAPAWPAVPAYEPVAVASASNSHARADDRTVSAQRFPSVPEYAPPAAPSPATAAEGAGDDKQELQRRRLLAEASAPPAEAPGERSTARGREGEGDGASVPALLDAGGNEVAQAQAGAEGAEGTETTAGGFLPRYER